MLSPSAHKAQNLPHWGFQRVGTTTGTFFWFFFSATRYTSIIIPKMSNIEKKQKKDRGQKKKYPIFVDCGKKKKHDSGRKKTYFFQNQFNGKKKKKNPAL